MIAVIAVSIFSKSSKIGKFLYNHFNIEMEEKTAFSAYYDYYFSKGKNTTEVHTHTYTHTQNLCNVWKSGCDFWNHKCSVVCEVLC